MQVGLPTSVFKCAHLSAKHIQFIRSIPAPALMSTLVGMRSSRHVKMNLEVIQHEPLTADEFIEFLKPNLPKREPDEAFSFEQE
jgi:aryl-alcohol dehydrogenase-like predicted oxidoreductase